MAAMLTVLAAAAALGGLGVREVREAVGRRAGRRRLRALAEDEALWEMRERIRRVCT